MAKKPKPSRAAESNLEFLKNLENEDLMHDDHGPVIIGRRDQKPQIPEDEVEKPRTKMR